jgi:DNA mismatch repair protein MutS
MQIDPVTYADLGIFDRDDESSLFARLDFTTTSSGRQWLREIFEKPLGSIEEIVEMQRVVATLHEKLDGWPRQITNGTLLVVEKFLDYNLERMPDPSDRFGSLAYRLFNAPDFSLARFSITHMADLVAGCRTLVELQDTEGIPHRLRRMVAEARQLLEDKEAVALSKHPRGTPFTIRETIRFGRFFHDAYRNRARRLMEIYGQLDAWCSMARAMKAYNLRFPELVAGEDPFLRAEGLYHLLLTDPKPYDVEMKPDSNFIFLTGANMAGKSTFIKAVGLAAFMTHLGMGVPAASMRLSIFDGILTNINVADNLAKGESYFFNEVQRIRHTVTRINDGRRWLVLIDELFKGTNIQDAMKCSIAVIRGLIRIRRALYILSTHLYEIGEELRPYPNISFRHFETNIKDDGFEFSFRLKEGISSDRLGYLILKREKVIDLLERL